MTTYTSSLYKKGVLLEGSRAMPRLFISVWCSPTQTSQAEQAVGHMGHCLDGSVHVDPWPTIISSAQQCTVKYRQKFTVNTHGNLWIIMYWRKFDNMRVFFMFLIHFIGGAAWTIVSPFSDCARRLLVIPAFSAECERHFSAVYNARHNYVTA